MENDANIPSLIRMSPDGFADFMRLIERPAEAVPQLVELLKREAPWEVHGLEVRGSGGKSSRDQ